MKDRKAYMKAYRKKHPEKFGIKKGQGKKKPQTIIIKETKPEPEPMETPEPIAEQTNPEPMQEKEHIGPTEAEPVTEQEKPEPTPEPTAERTGEDDRRDFFTQLNDEYKPKEENVSGKEEKPFEIPTIKAEPEPEENKLMISGYMFLLAVNIIYPELLLGLLKFFSKKYNQVQSENIALDETQIGLLEEIADEFIKVYLPKVNPMALFLICLNGMYFSNIKKELQKTISV